jgi:hypothetical protein
MESRGGWIMRAGANLDPTPSSRSRRDVFQQEDEEFNGCKLPIGGKPQPPPPQARSGRDATPAGLHGIQWRQTLRLLTQDVGQHAVQILCCMSACISLIYCDDNNYYYIHITLRVYRPKQRAPLVNAGLEINVRTCLATRNIRKAGPQGPCKITRKHM